jgi:hypothetical protein
MSLHMVGRGKGRKKISKSSKSVEIPQSKNFVCLELYFEKLANSVEKSRFTSGPKVTPTPVPIFHGRCWADFSDLSQASHNF